MISVGDRIEISINGAIRKAVVLLRFNTSSSGKPGFVLGLNMRYRSGVLASWSPVKRNRHDLVVNCFKYSVDPNHPLCYTWYDGDASIQLIQKLLGADVDTVRVMRAADPIDPPPTEKICPNPTCKKTCNLTDVRCWWCCSPL